MYPKTPLLFLGRHYKDKIFMSGGWDRFPFFAASRQNIFLNLFSCLSATNLCNVECEDLWSKHFTFSCHFFFMHLVCKGLKIHRMSRGRKHTTHLRVRKILQSSFLCRPYVKKASKVWVGSKHALCSLGVMYLLRQPDQQFKCFHVPGIHMLKALPRTGRKEVDGLSSVKGNK